MQLPGIGDYGDRGVYRVSVSGQALQHGDCVLTIPRLPQYLTIQFDDGVCPNHRQAAGIIDDLQAMSGFFHGQADDEIRAGFTRAMTFIDIDSLHPHRYTNLRQQFTPSRRG